MSGTFFFVLNRVWYLNLAFMLFSKQENKNWIDISEAVFGWLICGRKRKGRGKHGEKKLIRLLSLSFSLTSTKSISKTSLELKKRLLTLDPSFPNFRFCFLFFFFPFSSIPETSARIQMQNYIAALAPVVTYIDELFLSRGLGLDWWSWTAICSGWIFEMVNILMFDVN